MEQNRARVRPRLSQQPRSTSTPPTPHLHSFDSVSQNPPPRPFASPAITARSSPILPYHPNHRRRSRWWCVCKSKLPRYRQKGYALAHKPTLPPRGRGTGRGGGERDAGGHEKKRERRKRRCARQAGEKEIAHSASSLCPPSPPLFAPPNSAPPCFSHVPSCALYCAPRSLPRRHVILLRAPCARRPPPSVEPARPAAAGLQGLHQGGGPRRANRPREDDVAARQRAPGPRIAHEVTCQKEGGAELRGAEWRGEQKGRPPTDGPPPPAAHPPVSSGGGGVCSSPAAAAAAGRGARAAAFGRRGARLAAAGARRWRLIGAEAPERTSQRGQSIRSPRRQISGPSSKASAPSSRHRRARRRPPGGRRNGQTRPRARRRRRRRRRRRARAPPQEGGAPARPPPAMGRNGENRR